MEERLHNRRREDPQMEELKDMIAALSTQMSSLSSRLNGTETKVTELVTYLERGRGIWWLFKMGLAVAPIIASAVAGMYWLINHLKP